MRFLVGLLLSPWLVLATACGEDPARAAAPEPAVVDAQRVLPTAAAMQEDEQWNPLGARLSAEELDALDERLLVYDRQLRELYAERSAAEKRLALERIAQGRSSPYDAEEAGRRNGSEVAVVVALGEGGEPRTVRLHADDLPRLPLWEETRHAILDALRHDAHSSFSSARSR